MKTLKQMINEANEYIKKENPIQLYWDEDIFCDFGQFEDFDEINIVHKGEIDEHRWYGFQDVVFKLKIGDDIEYVRTNIVTQSYSETQGLDDICSSYGEFEIVHPKTVQAIVYE